MTLTPQIGTDYTQPELPARAARKLADFRNAADEASAVFGTYVVKMRDLQREEAVRPELANEVAQLRLTMAQKMEVRDTAAQIVARCLDFVNTHPKLVDCVGKIDNSRTLEELRNDIGKLRAEAAQIARTPPTAATVADRARARLGVLGELRLGPDGTFLLGTGDALKVIALVAPDLVEAAIDRAASAYPETGMDDAERRLRQRDIDDAILAAERAEEALIEAGAPAARRKNASPLALLGLAFG